MDEKTVLAGKGTSLAVRQFVRFLRSEDEPHEPVNPWRVRTLAAEERYCLGCCDVRLFDVVEAVTCDGHGVRTARCRVCGLEV